MDKIEITIYRTRRAGYCNWSTPDTIRGKCWRKTTTVAKMDDKEVFICSQHLRKLRALGEP